MERASTRLRVKKVDENAIAHHHQKKFGSAGKRSGAAVGLAKPDPKRVVLQTKQFDMNRSTIAAAQRAAAAKHVAHPIQVMDEYDDDEEEEEEEDDDDDEEEEMKEYHHHLPNSDDTVLEEEDDEEDEEEGFQSPSLTNPGALYPQFDKSSVQFLARLSREYEDKPGIWDDNDEDTLDVSMVCEYSDEIFAYMKNIEQSMLPDAGYMDNQTEIHWSTRKILVDWLVQVHARFNLLPETLYLTLNYMDRFLSIKTVSLSKFQLVGAVALFLAAKYEEINCPSVQEIAYMVDHGYSVDEILKAERYMIDLLDFNLGWPGPMSFLRRTSKADDYNLEIRTLAKYLLEVTIMDERFVASPPSWLAASAHCLARTMLTGGDWTNDHAYFGGYTKQQLEPAVQVMLECCRDPLEHHKSIYEKYADRKYKRASLFVADWIKSGN